VKTTRSTFTTEAATGEQIITTVSKLTNVIDNQNAEQDR